jgi:maltose alpha-D-glucosyltransferase/alpha-amylase
LRVITELVVNHTSDQHPWFQQSRRSKPGSPWRDFYVWSDTPDRYSEARIIFRDFETSNWTWDPVANAYFWHRFYNHQPDLNYDNPQVHREVTKALDFWLDLGVDGVRLDAVPYLYEREGTSCENLRETHGFLKTLRQHVDEKYGDRMLLAEANQWPEDAVTYFGGGKGDECHMAFHFPLMPRIFMGVRMEDRVPIVDILEQTPAIPETSQWALFLRNHDELTLEMVTDEERDYMYRVYAHDLKARINLGIRRRLAPLLGNSRRRIELLHQLLLSFPGTPVLYYGDEIGMGDNVYLGDRNGVRTPMQWSSDKNAGFSRASPQALYLPIILDPEYHYEAVNVEAQELNPNSLWWWLKRLLALRKQYQAFGRGTVQFLKPANRKILAFVRRYENEAILVIANLSRFPQPAELDLAEFKDTIPLELFGRTEFPPISERPYFMTLSPHAAFWFDLQPVAPNVSSRAGEVLRVAGGWENLLNNGSRARLETCLISYLRHRRWFGGKGRPIKSLQLRDVVPFALESAKAFLLILSVEYVEGDPEDYLLPVAFATGEQQTQLEHGSPQLIVAHLQLDEPNLQGVLYDAVGSKEFAQALLDAIAHRRSFPGEQGELRTTCPSALGLGVNGNGNGKSECAVSKAEQSNTAIVFDDKYILKLFRRVEAGTNPDLEIGRFLTDAKFSGSPGVAGSLEYRRRNGESATLGILTDFLSGAQNAWEFTLDTLGRYFERVRTAPEAAQVDQSPAGSLLELAQGEVPHPVAALLGTYLESARLLGQRTGEMHLALASNSENRDFAPEPFTPFYQRSLYQSMRNLAVQNLYLLRQALPRLDDSIRPDAERVAALEIPILNCFRSVYETRITAQRIRCHGDFHLGQVLHTGKDFVIIDFEGEPARPLGERRIKRSPLRDVAGMLRSFDYITQAALFQQIERGSLLPEHLLQIEPWRAFWYRWVSSVYLRAYLRVVGESSLLPKTKAELSVLLNAHLLEKAVYEVAYELNNRPAWLKIPLYGILQLLEAETIQK